MDLVAAHLEHLRRRRLASGTIDARRRKLTALDVPLGQATSDQIERFLDGRDLSPKSRYDWISHLSQFYRWAIDHGHLHDDPTARLARPRLRRRLPRPISTPDLMLAMDLAGPVMKAWLILAAYAGLRCAEIAHLDVDSILWNDALLRVVGKGQKERLIPMHPAVERTLRMHPIPKRGRVFRRPRGGGYPPAQVSREIALYLDSLGIAATAHQLRHWFGTHVYRVSRDLRVTQELMGHASPTTTAVYADWSRQEARRAIESLDAARSDESSLFSEW